MPPPGSVSASGVIAGSANSDPSAEVLGRRIRAVWIDLGLLGVLFVGVSEVFGGFHSGSSTIYNRQTTVHNSGLSVSLTGIPLVLFLIAELLYYFTLEARSGHTVGKRLMRIGLMSVDGSPASIRASVWGSGWRT